MESRNFAWSATTCDFPGAGVYLGLAPRTEHQAVARGLSPKQVRVVSGGLVRLRKEGEHCHLIYYAVRDPSAVKVKPLDKPPLPNGFRHVKLVFQFDRSQNQGDGADAARTGQTANDIFGFEEGVDQTTSCFLLTIGLPLAREERFYQEAVGEHPDQDWGDLYRRMKELGCREVS